MKHLFLTLFLVSISFIYAQETKSKGNLNIGVESNMQYLVYDELDNSVTEDNFRSNNYVTIDYNINKFSFGLQVEGYAPKSILNFSPSYNKQFALATAYVKYKTDKLEATTGHFYEQFGSGLTLRSWEDRQLGINNALLGARVKYNLTNNIESTGLVARQRYGFKLSESNIYGFNTEINLAEMSNFTGTGLNIGLSFVGKDEPYVSQNPGFKGKDFPNYVYTTSSRIGFTHGGFYTNAEYVYKSDDVRIKTNTVHEGSKYDGNAILLTLGYSQKGMGISGTYRRLENMNFYSERTAAGNLYNEQIMNYIPGLTKQHDYSLTNIYVYVAQSGADFSELTVNDDGKVVGNVKDGEQGGQIDFYYKFKKGSTLGGKYGTKIAANFSQWGNLYTTIEQENHESIYDTNYTTDLFNYRTLYYRDFNLEVRKKWSKKLSSIFSYVNLFYNKSKLEGPEYDEVNANIFIAESTYKLGKGKAIRTELQHLSTQDDQGNWVAGTLEYNYSTKLGFFATDMYNYGFTENHYYNFGSSYTKNKTRIALSYGKQRDGLLCVGGVCRFVPASTGVNMSITTSF